MTKHVFAVSFVAMLGFSLCHAGNPRKITFYGIYEVKGDELRVCGDGVDTASENNPEGRRPKKYDSKEGLLLVFKRDKK
jgi:hypothetical protein